MKTFNIILFFIAGLYLFSVTKSGEEVVLIPNDSIRLRIIANSNTVEDQILKYDLVNKISNIFNITTLDFSSIEETRAEINKKIPLVKNAVNELGLSASVNYGNNYFPDKTYKGINYEDGNYESLVVTIGEGRGENFWCVLFPPLCEYDTIENISDAEYSFYIKNIIDKYI